MQIEWKHRPPCWFEVHGVTSGPFIQNIQAKLKRPFRFWDTATNCWVVHWAYITWVTSEAKKYFFDVTYNTLPDEWQMRAAGAVPITNTIPIGIPDLPSPFSILHLADNAPISVVRAAYKALAMTHHPDHGGSTEKFQELEDAYQRCLEVLEKTQNHS
jgi:hypothetical protein